MTDKKISCTKCKRQIDARGWSAHIRGKTCDIIAYSNTLIAKGFVQMAHPVQYNWLWTPFVLNNKVIPDWLKECFFVAKGLNGTITFLATPQCAEYIQALHKLKSYRRHAAYHADLQQMLTDEMFAAQVIIAAEFKP